ncbi:MAG: ATP-binding cassette domain-containing protein, partial [Candidatus Dormibacteraeota bacterium]|nr:ATP-binding cassette domain-containing protein [Candidatus Dormibacteraeota bacterium]
AGRIEVCGKDLTGSSPSARLAEGLAYIPEDRSTEGLVLDLSVYENAVLRRQRQRHLRRFGLLSRRRMRHHAASIVEAYDVRPRSVEAAARALSGGNQQKLLVGREVSENPRVLMISQPTRGVDVSAANAIHRRLLDARADGRAVLVSSLDLDEITSLCDRVVVMFRGTVAGVLTRDELDDERLGLLMAGVQ